MDDMMYKQVIVVRDDLEMSEGKLISQCCHASLHAWQRSDGDVREDWESRGGKKVVLKAEGEEDIIMMMRKAQKLGLPHYLVKDRGLTEVPSGSVTALGIGPEEDGKIDQITGNLPLL